MAEILFNFLNGGGTRVIEGRRDVRSSFERSVQVDKLIMIDKLPYVVVSAKREGDVITFDVYQDTHIPTFVTEKVLKGG